MKNKLAIPLLALSLITGCSNFEKTFLRAKVIKQASSFVEENYFHNFGQPCHIEDFGLSSKKDVNPDKPILFFIHGWGSCLEDYLNTSENGDSKIQPMREVFEDRVIMADYPSNLGVNDIFLGLEKDFLDFENEYSKNNVGKKPNLIIAGHSLGTQIERMFVRKYSEDIKKAGFIAGVHNGLRFGPFTNFFEEEVSSFIDSILIENNKFPSPQYSQSIREMVFESDFMNQLNTSTSPLQTVYCFYAFYSEKGNPFIFPKKNDKVTSLDSAYPLDLIKDKKFEDVPIGDVEIFYDRDHFSLSNKEIALEIFNSLKLDNSNYSRVPPSLKEAKWIKIN